MVRIGDRMKTARRNRNFSKTKEDRIFEVVSTVIILIMTLVVLLPLVNVIAASFSSGKAVNAGKAGCSRRSARLYVAG